MIGHHRLASQLYFVIPYSIFDIHHPSCSTICTFHLLRIRYVVSIIFIFSIDKPRYSATIARISLSLSSTLPSAVMISQHMANSVSLKSSATKGAACSITMRLPCVAWSESALTDSSFSEELLNLEERTSIRDNCSICAWVSILPPDITDANKIATDASCSLVMERSIMTKSRFFACKTRLLCKKFS
jgi:hypothetical protein